MEIKQNNIVKKIGSNHPIFIIAEMSANHHQSIDKAKEIIDAAADAGVDAIKLQTYTPDTITLDCDNEYFQIKNNKLWGGQTLHSLYGTAYTPWEWHAELQQYAQDKGLIFFSTPFDATAVDFLENLNVPLHKVASFEVVDIPLLEKIGATGKPVIMSRGMSTEAELELAAQTLKNAGTTQLAILHCVSSYPAKYQEMNLTTIPYLKDKYDVVVGLSDHSPGDTIPVSAIGLGMQVLEKHLIMSRDEGGPDSSFSLEPQEFKELVDSIRSVEQAMGQPATKPGENEAANVKYRKSLFVVKDVKAGEEFTPDNVRSIRPGHGLPPKEYKNILNKKAAQDIKRGTPLSWELIN